MLKGIDPLLDPELLHVLARMGHGDEIVVADANFPAATIASSTVEGRELRMSCNAIDALRAILTLLPLDDFEPDPVLTMQVVGDAAALPEAVRDALPVLSAVGAKPASLERYAFYERARSAFAIVQTLELRTYGNFILRKGVIARSG